MSFEVFGCFLCKFRDNKGFPTKKRLSWWNIENIEVFQVKHSASTKKPQKI